MGWHKDANGIWSRYADSPAAAELEIKRINTALARGQSVGGASNEYGQTLATLLLLPIGVHAVTSAALAGSAAAAAGATAAGGTAAAGGTGLGLAAGVTGASLIGLAGTGLKIGAGLTVMDWLTKNWWIPAILMGAYIGIKLVK